jgi:hypothetical protein
VRILVAAVLLLAASTGCYSPSYRDCELTCGMSGMCPSGFKCEGGVCRASGASGPCEAVGDAGTDGGGSPRDYLDQALAAQCALKVRCGMWESEAACMVFLQGGLQSSVFGDITAAVDAGLVHFDADAAQRCIDAFDQIVSCSRDIIDTSRMQSESCIEVFTGTLDSGETCALNQECKSQHCEKPNNCPASGCCGGTCIGSTPPSVKQVGDLCAAGFDICANSYCDAATAVCTDFKGMLSSCTSTDQCALGLYCPSATAQCTARRDRPAYDAA